MAVLEVEGLRVRRDGVLAVDDVSFQLAAESDTALVGPNGAGKSSLVEAILGHRLGPVRPAAGAGPRPAGLSPPGPAAPGTAAPDHGRVRRLRLGSARSAPALARTGCGPLAGRLLSELSGGQRKRVLLAFCVVRPRRLLVLDEAQAGLDAPSTEQFHRLLFDLRRSEGWTVLQVSHDLDMVRRSCDQVLCLNRQLRCSGRPELALSRAQLERLYDPAEAPDHSRLRAPEGSPRIR